MHWQCSRAEQKTLAITVRQFLGATRSQLTYYGLFHLSTAIPPDTLVALYRNLHLSVLYKDAKSGSLYSLVTDGSFAKEPSVVWERIGDVDGESSVFVDSEFRKSVPFGGDFVGQTGVLGETGVESPGESVHVFLRELTYTDTMFSFRYQVRNWRDSCNREKSRDGNVI